MGKEYAPQSDGGLQSNPGRRLHETVTWDSTVPTQAHISYFERKEKCVCTAVPTVGRPTEGGEALPLAL